MQADDLAAGLPDLTLVVRRDGRIVSWEGGSASPGLQRLLADQGQFSEAASGLIARMARQCISVRATMDATLREAGSDYDLRVMPRSPERVVMTIRPALARVTDHTIDDTGLQRRPAIERRGFTRLLRDRLALATVQERPLSVAVIQLDGTLGVSQALGQRVAERVLSAALERIGSLGESGAVLVGQLTESVLAVIVGTDDRACIEAELGRVCAALRSPVEVQGIEYRLDCFVGVSTTERGLATPTIMLDQASAAAHEARQAGQASPRFHSDTVRVKALERLDLVHELRQAIEKGEVALRLAPRCDLASGAPAALLGYLHWSHPLRGSVRPVDFLNIAEGTGLAPALSRAALEALCAGFSRHARGLPSSVRLSFGPLRDHVLEPDFATELLQRLDHHGVPAGRIEVRIAERTFIACDTKTFDALRARDVRLVVDEVGREASSLASLAHSSLWGLQIDRRWPCAPGSDFAARKVCRSVAALASALGIEALATGVDDERRRDVLLGLGFRYGSGDLYRADLGAEPIGR